MDGAINAKSAAIKCRTVATPVALMVITAQMDASTAIVSRMPPTYDLLPLPNEMNDMMHPVSPNTPWRPTERATLPPLR